MRETDGSVLVDGDVPVRDVNRALASALPEHKDFTTMAGLCLHLAAGIPNPGDVLSLASGARVEIVEASPRRVKRVRLRLADNVQAETTQGR